MPGEDRKGSWMWGVALIGAVFSFFVTQMHWPLAREVEKVRDLVHQVDKDVGTLRAQIEAQRGMKR